MDTLLYFFTVGAMQFSPKNGLLKLLTLDARTSYPWPLCWGNALWGYVAYKLYREKLAKKDKPGFIFGCAITFATFTMPANIFTNLLVFSKTPSAFTNKVILPCHVFCCFLIEYVPGVFPLLSGDYMLTFIDSFGVLDNVTTALNFMEDNFKLLGAPYAAVLAAMTVNLAGGILRHFMKLGYTQGAAELDAAIATNVLYSIATNSLYFYFAIWSCLPVEVSKKGKLVAEVPECPYADVLYTVLPLMAVVKNALPLFMPAKPVLKHKRT